MSKIEQLLLGTYHSDKNIAIYAWNYNTGNIEYTYKNGGTPLSNSVVVLGEDYLLTANQDKPLLHIWPVNSQEQVKDVQFIMPEVVNSLDVDPSNTYLVAGIGLKLYTWHINSGKIFHVLQKHYQPITHVKFSSDSAYVVAASKDGMLIVYKLADIVTSASSYAIQKNIEECEPLYKKMDHSAQITSLSIGNFGSKSRIVTISNDQTCNVYMLDTGHRLLSLTLTTKLSSVLFDSTSWNLYIGDAKGLIKRISLKNPPRTLQYHPDSSQDDFIGHQKKITCLDLNIDNSILVSGGEDCNIIIWKTINKSMLRKIECNGIVTNLKFVMKFSNFQTQTFNPKIILHPFQRSVTNTMKDFIICSKQNPVTFEDEDEEREENWTKEALGLESTVNHLKVINKQIYNAFIKMAKEYNDLK